MECVEWKAKIIQLESILTYNKNTIIKIGSQADRKSTKHSQSIGYDQLGQRRQFIPVIDYIDDDTLSVTTVSRNRTKQ